MLKVQKKKKKKYKLMKAQHLFNKLKDNLIFNINNPHAY